METPVEEINLPILVDAFAAPADQAVGDVVAVSVRGKIENIEAEMLKHPQVDCPLLHLFAPGVYARQITIPAGTVLTGKMHLHDDINVLLSGEIDVMTEYGMQRMVGPNMFVAKAETKKLGHAITDVVWVTFHANPQDITDVDALVATLVHNDREDGLLLQAPAPQRLIEGEEQCQ